MRKIGIIILIIILTIMTIGLSNILIRSIQNDGGMNWIRVFNFGDNADIRMQEYIRKEEKITIDGISKMDLNFASSDLNIYFTDDQEIRIIQYSYEKLRDDELFVAKKSGKELEISERRKKHFYFFYFNRVAFDVYLPKQYEGDLSVKSVSGDIKTEENLRFNSLKLETTSGDIRMNTLKAKEIKIESVSGDIRIEDVQSDHITLKSVSGNISLESAKNSVEAKSTSGDIAITKIEGNIILETISGKITSEQFKITGDSKVKTTSGDVTLVLEESSNCQMQTKTVSGNVALPKGRNVIGEEPYAILDVKTVSGNIQFTK